MFAAVMRFAVLMGLLTAIYIALGWYMRWDRRRQLMNEHDSGEGKALTQEDYVAKGMAQYDRSWERKLLWGVYLIPILIALGIALLTEAG